MALKKRKTICIALLLIVFVFGALFAIKKYNAQRHKVFLTKLIENGSIQIIDDYFTNHSGELNPDYYQVSPLYCALFTKKYDVAKFLLKKGANPNQKYIEHARTDHPKYDRVECVSYVLPTLVRQTTDGDDDLHEGLALMDKLICMGADIYQVNWTQGTPDDPSLWYFAATTGNILVLKTLLKYNPNVNYTAVEDNYSCIKGILLRTDKYLYTPYDRVLAILLLQKHGATLKDSEEKERTELLNLPHNKLVKKILNDSIELNEKINEIEKLRAHEMKHRVGVKGTAAWGIPARSDPNAAKFGLTNSGQTP